MSESNLSDFFSTAFHIGRNPLIAIALMMCIYYFYCLLRAWEHMQPGLHWLFKYYLFSGLWLFCPRFFTEAGNFYRRRAAYPASVMSLAILILLGMAWIADA